MRSRQRPEPAPASSSAAHSPPGQLTAHLLGTSARRRGRHHRRAQDRAQGDRGPAAHRRFRSARCCDGGRRSAVSAPSCSASPETRTHGWTSARTVTSLAVSGALLAAFLVTGGRSHVRCWFSSHTWRIRTLVSRPRGQGCTRVSRCGRRSPRCLRPVKGGGASMHVQAPVQHLAHARRGVAGCSVNGCCGASNECHGEPFLAVRASPVA